MRYYYGNILNNQNKTAKSNIVWVADITEIEINDNKKFYIFLCIDVHTNKIIATTASQRTIKSQSIIKYLVKAINKRFLTVPNTKVILHTDRGTQFTSEIYNKFIKKFELFIEPSMSRENTPTDNAVAERFMRTFKEFKIDGKIIEQAIQEIIISNASNQSKSKTCLGTVKTYAKKLNQRANNKSIRKGPEQHDNDVNTASIFMREPLYPKAFSAHIGPDHRRLEVNQYKNENLKVIHLLEQFAAKKAEIVDETPFDSFENKLVIELLEKHLNELYQLIQINQLTIQQSVENSLEKGLEPINDNLEIVQQEITEGMQLINKKLDQLLPKLKKNRQVQPLRDPIDGNLLPLFLANAGNSAQRMKDLRKSQLRVAYTILYHSGLRINEIRHLTRQDIETAISAAQFNLIHHKTKQAHIHVLSKKAIKDLKDCRLDLLVIFDKYKYKYLFGKHKPLNNKYFIDMVNKDLEATCQKFSIPFNIKSHSFRINMITNLLKVTTVQNTADIIGHSDIRSTMQYNRYALSKNEIQDLLDKITDTTHIQQ